MKCRRYGNRDGPEIDKLFGFLVGCEIVDVYQQWVERDDLDGVLLHLACLEQAIRALVPFHACGGIISGEACGR
jgi:hypothetical protein